MAGQRRQVSGRRPTFVPTDSQLEPAARISAATWIMLSTVGEGAESIIGVLRQGFPEMMAAGSKERPGDMSQPHHFTLQPPNGQGYSIRILRNATKSDHRDLSPSYRFSGKTGTPVVGRVVPK